MPSLLSGSILRQGGSNTFIQLSGAQPQLPTSETTETGFTLVTDDKLVTTYRSSLGYLAFHSGTITNQLGGQPIELLATGTSTVLISGTQTSVNTLTGALVVHGGIGVAGTIHADDNDIYVNRRHIGATYSAYLDPLFDPHAQDRNRGNLIFESVFPNFSLGSDCYLINIGGNCLTYDPIPQDYGSPRSNSENIAIGINVLNDNNTRSIGIGSDVLTNVGKSGEFIGTITNLIINYYTYNSSVDLSYYGFSYLEPTLTGGDYPDPTTTTSLIFVIKGGKINSTRLSGFIGSNRDSLSRYRILSLLNYYQYIASGTYTSNYIGADSLYTTSTLSITVGNTHNFMPGLEVRVYRINSPGWVEGTLEYSLTDRYAWTVIIPPPSATNFNSQQVFVTTYGQTCSITALGDVAIITTKDNELYTLEDTNYGYDTLTSTSYIQPLAAAWNDYSGYNEELGITYNLYAPTTITVSSKGDYEIGDLVKVTDANLPLDWWCFAYILDQRGTNLTTWDLGFCTGADSALFPQEVISDLWYNEYYDGPTYDSSNWVITHVTSSPNYIDPFVTVNDNHKVYNNIAATANIAIGNGAASNLCYGNQNFILGDNILPNLKEGSNNFFMGHETGQYLTSVNNCISIGGDNIVDNVDNQINIGSVFYYNGSGYLQLNAHVGLGLGDGASYEDPEYASFAVLGGGDISDNLIVRSTAPSVSTQSGALIVNGGIGVGGGMVVEELIFGDITNAQNLDSGATGSIPYQASTSTTIFVEIGDDGKVLKSNGVFPYWGDSTATVNVELVAPEVYDLVYIKTESIGTSTDKLYSSESITFDANTGALTISSSVVSTAFNEGALVVGGGVGIGGDLNVGGGLSVDENTVIHSTQGSTATDNGALVVAGGAGISENLHVGNNAYTGNDLYIGNDVNVGGDVAVTSTVTAAHVYSDDGGVDNLLYVPRVFVQSGAPGNARVGEFWYDLDSGGRYQLVNDGGNLLWVGF